MGNQQPKKKVSKATKNQIQVACLKAKIHLQMIRDRKNAEIVKGEKQLVAKIKAKCRNKAQELLIMERVVNNLKYAQACNQLMAYAASLKGQAQYLAENQNNLEKLQLWLKQIYSLIYAAGILGFSSLNEFRAVMKALNDPVMMKKHVNPQIIQQLTPEPLSEQMNIYILEMAKRNGLSLEQINLIGHKFKKEFNPSTIPKVQQSFEDMERKLAQEMKKTFQPQEFHKNPTNENLLPKIQQNRNQNMKNPHFAYYDIDREIIPPYMGQKQQNLPFQDNSQINFNQKQISSHKNKQMMIQEPIKPPVTSIDSVPSLTSEDSTFSKSMKKQQKNSIIENTYPDMFEEPKKVEYFPITIDQNTDPTFVNLQDKSLNQKDQNKFSRTSHKNEDEVEYFPELRPGSIDMNRFKKQK